ncbi:M23 family metallopeptidase [Pseudomonas aeruginosa]
MDFARISSRFSLGRRHPILNKIRAHKGVDYAAPIGTPIKAHRGRQDPRSRTSKGYGNAVVIQHGQRYRTIYGHMSRFAKGYPRRYQREAGPDHRLRGHDGLGHGPHLHYGSRSVAVASIRWRPSCSPRRTRSVAQIASASWRNPADDRAHGSGEENPPGPEQCSADRAALPGVDVRNQPGRHGHRPDRAP